MTILAYKLNPFTKKLDFYGAIPTGASDPSSASDGDLFINTTDNGYKVYYSGSWQTLHTLTAAALSYFLQEDGASKIVLEDGSGFFALQ